MRARCSTIYGGLWRAGTHYAGCSSGCANRNFDVSGRFVRRGLDVATTARYWYAVGFAERVLARMARDSCQTSESLAAYVRAEETFDRIGARFELERTREEAARETTPL